MIKKIKCNRKVFGVLIEYLMKPNCLKIIGDDKELKTNLYARIKFRIHVSTIIVLTICDFRVLIITLL